MDARSGIQWIVAIFAIVAEFSFITLTALVYAYGDDIDLRVSAVPDSSKGWIAQAEIGIPDYFYPSGPDFGISLTHTKIFNLRNNTYMERLQGREVK